METNEVKIPQLDEAEIPQSKQSKELDRSDDKSSFPIRKFDGEKLQVTSASTIVDGDESNEGNASVLEEGSFESGGKGREHEVDEIMGDNVEEKCSDFDGSLVNEQLNEELLQVAGKNVNFLSFEEALVEQDEKLLLLVEESGDRVGEAKVHVFDEVRQESIEEKLLDFDGAHQNEDLKEELPLLDEKEEKISSLEGGLGDNGGEAHVFDEVKYGEVSSSSLQEELDGKEEKVSSLKQEEDEPSMSIINEQTVGEKEELNKEGPGSVEGGVKVHPLQEALIEKNEKVSPWQEALVEREGESKDHVDEIMHENVEEKLSDFDEKLVEKDEKVSQLQGDPVKKDKEGSDVKEDAEEMDIDEGGPAMAAGRRTAMKRKRGRPQASQERRIKARSKPKEDESLCFICFDGGDLVVCDHRSCPKVYHPSCVNRDEEYFKAKGQWICGWHICSNCQKSSRYMCYTCTYSVCKGCLKEADFACVRENRGFCQDCIKTVMLIETNKHADETTAGIDFDDKASWLSLFKDYWLDLNAKLSITLEELTRARNPLKEVNVASSDGENLNKTRVLWFKEVPSQNSGSAHDNLGESSSSRPRHHKESTSARKKLKKRPRNASITELQEAQVEQTSSSGDIKWASKELLKFVAYMRDGDKSVISHFDVQALVLEYIKQNNLRDPHRRSQINCDSRLLALFGKSRVGHIEMLKFLEPHFLLKETSPLATDDNQGGVVDPDPYQMDVEGNSHASTKTTLDARWKSCRRVEGGSTSLHEYVAIDVHNVSLLYLRRNLMENLLDDIDMFNENVVGTFVRIRISGSVLNNDMYRLVQVVGTGKATGKYKTGKKITDVTLEILNLNRREIITIDLISNQEFTEEECKRLRQSVKCGFIDKLTVAQVQEKARGLHAVRVTDWLESEKLRLGHLCDRASEKGCIKELSTFCLLATLLNVFAYDISKLQLIAGYGRDDRLDQPVLITRSRTVKRVHRECVEKLLLLSTPEEHIRRLNEVPDIHVDPHVDPDYESPEEDGNLYSERQDKNKMLKCSFRDGDAFPTRLVGSGTRKISDVACDSNTSAPKAGIQNVISPTVSPIGTDGLSRIHGRDACEISSPKTPKADVNVNGSNYGILKNSQPAIEPAQISGIQPQTAPQPPSTNAVSLNSASETGKMWHYQDPAGKIQGPFSMTQLRKWNSCGFFPTNLRIWKTSEKQQESILLTDAVSGKFRKDSQKQEPQHVNTNQPTNVAAATQPSSSSTAITGMVSPTDGRRATSSTGCESSKNFNAWSGQSQARNCPRPITPFSRNLPQQRSLEGRDRRGENGGRWNGGQGGQHNWNSNRPRRFPPCSRGYERQHPYRSTSGQRFSGEQLKVQQPVNLPAYSLQSGGIDWASLQGAINRIIPSPSPCNLVSSTVSSNNDATKTPTAVQETRARENKRIPISGMALDSAVASNPVASSNLPAQFAPVSAQEQGTSSRNVNPAQPPNMVYPTIPGASNMGWGMVAHGPMNMTWGAPATMNMGGWGQPAQAIVNPNLSWAVPAQGMPMQVSSAVNLGWAAPSLGNANPPMIGNANQSAAWGAMTRGTEQANTNNASNRNAGDGGSSHP